MADLKQNLATLDAAVPAFPDRVAAVARSAEALERTANTMLQQFEQKKGELEKLTEQVKQVLTEMQGEGTDQEGLVRNKADDAEAATETALAAIRSGRDVLLSAVEDAGEAFEGLRDHLTAAETRLHAAQDGANQALGLLSSGLETGQTELATGITGVSGAVEGVAQALDAGQAAVADATSALEERMTALLDAATGRLDATRSALAEGAATVENGMGEAMSDLGGRRDTLFQEMAARVESELRQRLDASLQVVVESLGLLMQTVTTTTDGLAAERDGVTRQLGEVTRRIPPLNAGVDSVKEAAQQVGISY